MMRRPSELYILSLLPSCLLANHNVLLPVLIVCLLIYLSGRKCIAQSTLKGIIVSISQICCLDFPPKAEIKAHTLLSLLALFRGCYGNWRSCGAADFGLLCTGRDGPLFLCHAHVTRQLIALQRTVVSRQGPY